MPKKLLRLERLKDDQKPLIMIKTPKSQPIKPKSMHRMIKRIKLILKV